MDPMLLPTGFADCSNVLPVYIGDENWNTENYKYTLG